MMLVNLIMLVLLFNINFKANECLFMENMAGKTYFNETYAVFNSREKEGLYTKRSEVSHTNTDNYGPSIAKNTDKKRSGNDRQSGLLKSTPTEENNKKSGTAEESLDPFMGLVYDDNTTVVENNNLTTGTTYNKTEPEQYPYAVFLVAMNEKNVRSTFCSGSLLTQEWVLTAAQCLGDSTFFWVYAGGRSGVELYAHLDSHVPLPKGTQVVKSTQFIRHPKYIPKKGFDVGLVRLDEKFEITPTVNTVKVAFVDWSHVYADQLRACVTTGYGLVSYRKTSPDDYHRKTYEPTVRKPCFCLRTLMDVTRSGSGPRHLLCAKSVMGSGICKGDSGGALVCDGRIFGIVVMAIFFVDIDNCKPVTSDIQAEVPENDCGHSNALNIFQEVYPSLDWILEVLQNRFPSDVGLNESSCNPKFVNSYWIHISSAVINICIFRKQYL